MAKITLNNDELEEHLSNQVQFLNDSCESFDKGFEAEAARIAIVARVLLHDTQNSRSLLGLLRQKMGTYFFDTAMPLNPNNLLPESPLLMVGLTKDSYLAPLDSCPDIFHRWRPFDPWWEEPVLKDSKLRTMSRRDLILITADQDGGAHVDPSLDEAFADLKNNNSLGWNISNDGEIRPISGAARVSVRQIGHEILRTLRKDYRKTRPEGENVGVYAFGGSMVVGAQPPPISPPLNALMYLNRIERNDPRR